MIWSLLTLLFFSVNWAALHIEKTCAAIDLAKDVPLKLQAGYGHCRCYCPKDKALAYVNDVDTVLTTYIQMGQFDMTRGLVSQTGTYIIVKPSRCAGCFKFQGNLDLSVLYGCIDSYSFEPIETVYYRNGVITVRGVEIVKKGGNVVFKGEVVRYYSADFGCQYRLELIIGTDERCTACCDNIGCHIPEPDCRLTETTQIVGILDRYN